ncbi:hypothetical protein PPGU19_082120 (plasmid) [Paraburkholderia sp. PGU19]|nr:hypothetical protein PPGU19_082120 [Paraburkholderia sp. PGU19]
MDGQGCAEIARGARQSCQRYYAYLAKPVADGTEHKLHHSVRESKRRNGLGSMTHRHIEVSLQRRKQ